MISFIVIGRNEGWKISKCLQSVFNAIKQNKLEKCEVIYVDSKSTDDSIDRAKKFEDIKIFQITGTCNAAIARNIGAKESKGNILFFIDGDIEINPEFIKISIDEFGKLVYSFISGQVININYNKNNQFISETIMYPAVKNSDKFFSTSGGIFLMDRSLWLEAGGMDNNFKRGQDHDLTLRLAKKGIPLMRKSAVICKHHTIAYTHEDRLWKTLFSGDIAYSNSFLFRKHFFNKNIYKKILKTNYSALALIITIFLLLSLKTMFVFSFYLLPILYKTIKNRNKIFWRNIELFIFFIVRDLFFLFYLFMPIKKIQSKDFQYNRIH